MSATTTPGVESRKPILGFAGKQALWGYLLVLPAVALVVGLVAYPFLYAIYISFTSRVVGNPGEWIGLEQLMAIPP